MQPNGYDDDLDADMEPHEHAGAGLKKACISILNKTDLSAAEKLKALKKFLLAGEKLAGEKLAADAGDDDDQDDLEDDADPDDDFFTKKKSPKKDGMVEAMALMLKLGKGRRRVAEAGRRPRTTVEQFKARHFRPAMDLKQFSRKLHGW